jgi:glutamate transport system permease protein
MSNVLFDVPGPRARRRHRIGGGVSAALLLGLTVLVVWKLFQEGQFEYALWEPFVTPVYMLAILEGVGATLMSAGVAIVFALVFGALFGIGRLSEHGWLRWPCAVVVEFFRAVPLLMLILAIFLGWGNQIGWFWALVIGLTLYNGSVLAEVFRAGILAVPRGQGEAAYSIGMRKNQVMRHVLLPQAVRIMLPAIVSQCVVALKDTALAYIITGEELASVLGAIAQEFASIIPAAIVGAAIYIAINSSLSRLAHWLEGRTRRAGGKPLPLVDPGAEG